MPAPSTSLHLIAQSASREEAAAVVAALERFMRATGPALCGAQETLGGWRRAALEEGVASFEAGASADPWINA